MKFSVDFIYQTRHEQNNFCLQMKLDWQAQVTGIYGQSGSGKSTFLEVLLGLKDEASLSGAVMIGNKVIFDSAAASCLPRHRRDMAWVPQDSLLLPHLTVAANLAMMGGGAALVSKVVSELGISALMTKKPCQLSGGELMLLDEPFSALDAPRRAQHLTLMQSKFENRGCSAIYVSHRAPEIRLLCDYVVVLEAGRVKWHGPRDLWQPLSDA
jgi:molybdate transport system ATP-binding protein